jgi:opacity protein-like surface antigen
MRAYLLLVTASLLFSLPSIAQRKADVGVFIGGSYYLGDINPNRQFYSPSYAIGGIYRYNFNKWLSLRLNGIYTSLTGNDADFPNLRHPQRGDVSFRTNLLDAAAQLEINFLPYLPADKPKDVAAYIALGAGYNTIIGSSSTGPQTPNNHPAFIFGTGVKYNVDSRLSTGLEWSFRKTFSDNLDGVVGADGNSLIHNNDWYSLFGIFITYKFFKFASECPAYN